MKQISISLILIITILNETYSDWNFWWTFDGISGPEFWGILNPDWHLCTKGRRQSPIDIKPELLLYDPNLLPIHINKNRVNGVLENNGHNVVFYLNNNQQESESSHPIYDSSLSQFTINISGGPLAYSYSFHSLLLHFGRTDAFGSEHTISGISFPAEIQILGYNSELYHNMSDASTKPYGLVGISLLIQIGETSSVELRILTSHLQHIRYRGQNVTIKSLSIKDLVPDDQFYMTYEGSLTMPACSEVVTWVVINKPLFITRQQLYALRKLMQGDMEHPKAPLGNNFRPNQPLNARVMRTNIDFKRKQGTVCPSMKKNLHYQCKCVSTIGLTKLGFSNKILYKNILGILKW